MRGDKGDEVRMHEQAGIEFAPAPCPRCGATNEDEAGRLCRPQSDQTGERECPGEFNGAGISVQATPESIAAMDAWIDQQVAKDNEDERKRSERRQR